MVEDVEERRWKWLRHVLQMNKTSRRTDINNMVEEVEERRWKWLRHVLQMNKTSRRTDINNMVEEVEERRWKWLRHVLQMNKTKHHTPHFDGHHQGNAKRGRSLGSWPRGTTEQEMKETGKT